MLKIKLSRIGSKNHPSYRIVVAEDRSKLSGKPVDSLGYYHPREKRFSIDKTSLSKWVKNGATLTNKVRSLINKNH